MELIEHDANTITLRMERLEAQRIQYALLRWLQMCGHAAICPGIPDENAITDIVNSGILMGS